MLVIVCYDVSTDSAAGRRGAAALRSPWSAEIVVERRYSCARQQDERSAAR